MSSARAPKTPDVFQDAANFSLILGGPLYQLLARAHLADDTLARLRRRILALALLPWLPLLGLSALEGNAWGNARTVPFLQDLDVHVRFLIVIPLLVLAELVVHQRLRPLVRTFLDRNLIPEPAMARFHAALQSAFRLRNSAVAECCVMAFVYGVGILILWREYFSLDAATWYALPSPEGSRLSIAGTWYGYVSLPIYQFLLVRWYFRLFIWARFLWQVSRIELQLVPTHPDRLGGLGFVSGSIHAVLVLVIAHGAIVAGYIANRIYHLGARLPDFKVEIALMVALLMCLVMGPLLVFSPQLAQAKRRGSREYGNFAERYVREFDAKWLRGGAPPDEPLVGTGDIQSLADLANSYEVVRNMRIAPITRDAAFQLAGAALAPIVPLALTMMPLEDLLKMLFGVLF